MEAASGSGRMGAALDMTEQAGTALNFRPANSFGSWSSALLDRPSSVESVYSVLDRCPLTAGGNIFETATIRHMPIRICRLDGPQPDWMVNPIPIGEHPSKLVEQAAFLGGVSVTQPAARHRKRTESAYDEVEPREICGPGTSTRSTCSLRHSPPSTPYEERIVSR